MKYDYYITGTIGVAYDWWTGQRGTTANDVRAFLKQHEGKELNIAVSSPGGYLDEGIAICEAIAAHGKCNMIIVGMTASAATVLCMKAKSVKIAKGSMMLIHNSSFMLNVWTSANKQGIDAIIDKFKKQRDELDTFDKAIASIYAGRNGKTIEENMAMMDKEKWMLGQDAIDFGIVDAFLDDEEAATQAKAVKNACAALDGFTQHYGLPEIPLENAEKRSFLQRMRDRLSSVVGVMNNVSEGDAAGVDQLGSINNNSKTMKKIILNLVCAVLAVQDLALNDEGNATLTEYQLKQLENSLKGKDGRISALEQEKKTAEEAKTTAENAKADAESKLTALQTEFDKFKNEAGDHSSTQVQQSEEHPVTSASMFNDIKDLL